MIWLYVLNAVLALFALLFAAIGLLYITRGTPIRKIRELEDDGSFPSVADSSFRDTIQCHVNTSLVDGNRIEILTNGEQVYPRLFDDLRAAESLITLFVYWYKPGELADQVKDILIERARAGVRVLFLRDAFGSHGISDEYLDEMRRAGVEVAVFRPLKWNTVYKFQQRSHMRAVVVDGCIGFTGGFAIEDRWIGDGRHTDQWRDTSVRVEGPAVLQLQAAFAADWAEATGELLVGNDVFPRSTRDERGSHTAGLFYSSPSMGSTDAERFFALSICGACKFLYITNAYFIPDDDFRSFLCKAVERGADVRILTPGENTDKKSTWYAARTHYEELLGGGVRVYEYRPTMVHAKTLVADDVWAAVGSMNFDNRSMALNDEVVLMMHDEELGGQLKSAFLEDIEYADELDLESFRTRGAWERAKERAAVVWSRVL
ncbi:MAG TPA: cardiolipin synthase [Longimicrobiaceae bacterium]|nr:cardiolipin synthase [Longimicrobiaceae bacterium]